MPNEDTEYDNIQREMLLLLGNLIRRGYDKQVIADALVDLIKNPERALNTIWSD